MLARLPQGQTLDSRLVGEYGRYLPRSGKPQNKDKEGRKEGYGNRWKSVRKEMGRGKWMSVKEGCGRRKGVDGRCRKSR